MRKRDPVVAEIKRAYIALSTLPAGERRAALQWLNERIADDLRKESVIHYEQPTEPAR